MSRSSQTGIRLAIAKAIADIFGWTQAARLAAQTPPERNRYADFLRAVSICMVIVGHWLVVAPYLNSGELVPADVLSLIPWSR